MYVIEINRSSGCIVHPVGVQGVQWETRFQATGGAEAALRVA